MTDSAACPTLSLSIVVALGPLHTGVPPELIKLRQAIADRHDVELLVVDDHAPEPTREGLANLKGPTRIRHGLPYAYGSDWAAVAGAVIAKGEILLVVRAELELEDDAIERVEAAFSRDESLKVVLGTDSSGAWKPVFAIKKSALFLLGGPRALAGSESATASVEAVPNVIAASIASGETSSQKIPLVRRRPTGIVQWRAEQPPEAALAPPFFDPVRATPRLRCGLNVIGLFEAACGIGDAARRYVDALETTRVEYATYPYHWHGSPPFPFSHHGPRTMPYDINVLALNPDTLPAFATLAGSELWQDRYTIGVWFWELETIGAAQRNGARFVNEVWVSTGFLHEAFSGIGREVVTVPLPVRRRDGLPALDRASLELPSAFVFLTMFDFNSLASRKNSIGAVKAFTRAFRPGEGPVLVVKTLNSAADPPAKGALDAAIGGRRDIICIDQYLDDEVIAALVGQADCFVSLHRAEGFGLSLADAMAWGRPVIATGYSGNLDFMTRRNSFLVDYDLVPIPSSVPFYPAGARWAEPRIEHAATLMRHVVEHEGEAIAVGARAQRDIRESNSLKAAARVMTERVDYLAELRAKTRPSPHRRQGSSKRVVRSRA